MSLGGCLVNIPKLRERENYDDWAFAATNFLILESIKLIITIDPKLYVHIKNESKVKNLCYGKNYRNYLTTADSQEK